MSQINRNLQWRFLKFILKHSSNFSYKFSFDGIWIYFFKERKAINSILFSGVGRGSNTHYSCIKYVMPIGSKDFLCLSAHRFKCNQGQRSCPLYERLWRRRCWRYTGNAHITEPFYLRRSRTVPSDEPDTTISLSLDINAHRTCNTSQSHVT